MRLSIPVDPDADEARRWAVEELSKAEYRAEPATWIARVGEWLRGLFEGLDGFGSGLGPVGTMLIIAVSTALVALIVWLVMGPLRRSRRVPTTHAVLGDDRRSAAELAASARMAANRGDWDTAVMEIYRASVRDLDARGVVAVTDGMTADEAARAIGRSIAGIGADVDAVAADFDVARYGGGGLGEGSFRRASDVHGRLERAGRTVLKPDAAAASA